MSSRWKDLGDIAVRRMAGVKPGENLLILADTETDPEVAQACFDAGIEAGARASLLTIPFMSPTDTSELDGATIRVIVDFEGGAVPPCNVHCDVVLTTAKIECDGRVMLEDNRLDEEMGFGGLS